MPKIISHFEVRPTGVYADGDEFPFYVSDEGLVVEHDHGVNLVTVRLICDEVTVQKAQGK